MDGKYKRLFAEKMPGEELATNQQIDRPTERMNRPTDHQIDGPSIRSTNQPTVRPTDKQMKQLIDRPINGSTERLTNGSNNGPTDGPTDGPTLSPFGQIAAAARGLIDAEVIGIGQ